MDGFTFGQWAGPDPREVGAGWFISTWLGRLEEFSPGPYNQLAMVMDESGHPTVAADVRYERSDEERALGWFLASWLTGFLVMVRRSEWSAGQAALYSLDRLVPAVKIADPGEFPPRTRAQRVWSAGQMLMGWLLTLFIVGWLGGLLVRA